MMKQVINMLENKVEDAEKHIRYCETMHAKYKEYCDDNLQDIIESNIKIADYQKAIDVLKAMT